MRITANKGEWSEFYTLIRLLAEGKIYTVKENLVKDDKCFLPILKIFRNESDRHHIEYRRETGNSTNQVDLYLNDEFRGSICISVLTQMANRLYKAITEGEGTFEIESAADIMQTLECQRIKAVSVDKSDIRMLLHDPMTNYERICGYSIKSDIGNPPTLFNASQATNFKFEILTDLTSERIEEINSINGSGKIKKRIRSIGLIKFVGVTNENFARNLRFVDTQMEKILAEMLKKYYSEDKSNCVELSASLEESDPLNLKTEKIYPHKLKKFLCAVALGLNPTRIWDGTDEANGGYLIVRDNGEIVAYHLHDRSGFENYLLNNTKFDTPSSTRHRFGVIYSEGNRNFINLNFQIRFI